MKDPNAPLTSQRLARLNGLLALAFLVVLLALLAGKQFGFGSTAQLLLGAAFCGVMASASLVTLLGFYKETKSLAATHRRAHDSLRFSLQWLVFLAAAAVSVFGVVIFTLLATATAASIFK